ncbi:Uncharacterized protein dnl_32100 [Desulfonema limicola]|uniref:Uncharacterized protein n=1 Tax=Desulfonema limicola TaxID=45656 RepID=A0A975GH44_9BACT|nr:hypothetical protein [Desulfonema limicola]QTA80894.1 Uncharacterized protein dnl_32100 [Desulfonema limicola]
MQKITYQTSIQENGQILLPRDFMDRYLLKPHQKINVTIEIREQEQTARKAYSFNKVRKLLKDVKGNMSEDIISDRDDRI